MFKWLAEKLINRAMSTPYFHLFKPDGSAYMLRYWLLPYNRWIPAARIHFIQASDSDRAFHDHPWSYLTIILKGGYYEVKPMFDKSGLYLGDSRVYYGAGSVLLRGAKSWHRLELANNEGAVTLFITGKYIQKWGFMENPKNKIAYTEYLNGMEQES